MQRLPLASHLFRQIHSSAASVTLRTLRSIKPNLASTHRRAFNSLSARTYAIMSQSHACCTVPPVVTDNYKEKGEYITVDGLKTYTTGDSSAKSAILVVYDIFGFFPQTLQGADILAHGDKEKKYQVFMPGTAYSGLCYRLELTRQQTFSKAHQQIYLGTHQTPTRRARSSASSSTTRLRLRRHSIAFPIFLKRSNLSALASPNGAS